MSLRDLLRRKPDSDKRSVAKDQNVPKDPDAFFGDVKVDFEAITNPRFEKFPNAGPFPWLDRPDAESQITARQKAHAINKDEAEQLRSWVANGYLIIKRAVEPDRIRFI